MPALQAAREQVALQRQLALVAIAAARRAWTAKDVAGLVRTLSTLMQRAGANGASSVGRMLAEQGLDAPQSGQVSTAALGQTASDGRPLASLLEQAESVLDLERMAWTQVADAGRAGQSVAMVARPTVTGYVRMLNPPSCSRCAVLAGKFYRWNAGFLRHPQCDCIHVPAVESTATDLTTNPNYYFVSLTREQQDATFTKAAAEAIRDGADISQVVNARRSMDVATVYGRQAVITREGITRRGVAGRRLGKGTPRLMPETIYQIAQDREDAIRLLRRFGFIL